MPFYDAVMNKGVIDARYKELAYLKTSSINDCRYWTHHHTASAKQAGVTDEQIEALRFYQRSDAFDEKEKVTIRLADIITRGATAVDADVLGYIGKYYSDDEIVELTMVISLANLVNRINDSLQIQPDVWKGSFLQFNPSSKQLQIILIEGAIQFSGVAQQPVHIIPEAMSVIFYAGVNQFVQYGVID